MKKTLLILLSVVVLCSMVLSACDKNLEDVIVSEPENQSEVEQPAEDESMTVTYLHPGDSEYQKYHDFIFREREYSTEHLLANNDKIIEEDFSIYLLTSEGDKILLIEGNKDVQFDEDGNEWTGDGVQSAHVFEMLDDYRFIYVIYGWEWTICCGLYDLQAFQDYRFSSAILLIFRSL